jgi:hypothetical protein
VVQAGRAGQLVTADNKGLVWYTWEGRDSRKQVLQNIGVVQARAGRLNSAVAKYWCGAGGGSGQLKTVVVQDWCGACGMGGAAGNSCCKGLAWCRSELDSRIRLY